MGTINVIENRRGLEALRYAAARLLDIASSVLVRIPVTEEKLQLTRDIWALAQAADTIGRRLPGLRSTISAAAPASDSYVAFTNSILALADPGVQAAALTQLAYPDLRDCAMAHRAYLPGPMDELTIDCLETVLGKLDGMKLHRGEAHPAFAGLRAQLQQHGGALGRAGEPTAGVAAVPALTEIPLRPGRAGNLVEADPGRSHADGSRGAHLHHTIFGIEMCAAEICAAIIAHHPEAAWELKFDLAKQVRDEGRHFELFAERMVELGANVGDYPIVYDIWDKFMIGQTLPERLMIEQRIGEGGALDGSAKVRVHLEQIGDQRTALIFDYVTADEITHVGNGNKWLRQLLGSDEAVNCLDLSIRARLKGGGYSAGASAEPHEGDRLFAGFTPAEVSELQRQWQETVKRASQPRS